MLSIEGRCLALATLQELRWRLDNASFTPKSCPIVAEFGPDRNEKRVSRIPRVEELSWAQKSTTRPLAATPLDLSSEEDPRYKVVYLELQEENYKNKLVNYLSCPNEVYDLQAKVLPRGGLPWRWCEGACRLRGNAGLTTRDVSQDWVEGGEWITCKYCSEVCFGKRPISGTQPETLDFRMRKAMKYFFECHALLLPSNRRVFVCHICFLRNRYDTQAGPMNQEQLWNHWYGLHYTSCSGEC